MLDTALIFILCVMSGGLILWAGLRAGSTRLKRHRARAEVAIAQLHAAEIIPDASVTPYPAPHLSGHYENYPLSVEFRANRREPERLQWCLHSRLHSAHEGKILLHGDARPSNMRALNNVEVHLSGDCALDRAVLMASSSPELLQPIRTAEIKAMFLALQNTHFQIEVKERSLYAEYSPAVHHETAELAAFLPLIVTIMRSIDA